MAKKDTNPHTQGIEPLLGAMPTVKDANGRGYTMRRLGLRDVSRLLGLLGEAVAHGKQDVTRTLAAAGDEGTEDAVVGLLLALSSLEHLEERFGLFICDVLGASLADWQNPDVFPLEIQTDALLKLFTEHRDAKAFFTKVQNAMKTQDWMKAFGTMLGSNRLTSSSNATA